MGDCPVLIVLPDTTRPVADALVSAADELAAGNGPAAVISQSLALPPQALRDLTADRPGGSSAFTAPAAGPIGIRVLHHRVVDVATDRHPVRNSNATSIGLLRLAAADRAPAGAALRSAAELAPTVVDPEVAFQWLLIALVRAGVTLTAEPADPWPWSRNGAPATLTEAAAERIRLQRANRADDGVYSVAVLRRLSKPLSALGARRGWSPNAITLASLIVGLSAAGLFAVGQRWAMVAGALLLQASIVIDCSDGEVARLTGRYSTLGAWLDASTDRVKEYAAYAGLAAGAAGGAPGIWWLAGATMTLQTGRHLSDYTFHRVQVRRETADVRRPLSDTTAAADSYAGIIAAATRINSHATLRSIKKAVFLPIGERWLIISLTAAFLSPWWTFGILLTAGALSACYAFAGRILRTRSWPQSAIGADAVGPQVDRGPIALLIQRSLPRSAAVPVLLAGLAAWAAGIVVLPVTAATAAALLAMAAVTVPAAAGAAAAHRFAWAIPTALAVLELSMWLTATAVLAPQSAPWGFALAGVVAYHRYDLLYRAMGGVPAPRWIEYITGGTDGRVIAMAVLAAAGAAAYATALPWLACVLAVTGVGVASAQWLAPAGREPR